MARRLPDPDEIDKELDPRTPGPSDSSDSGSDLSGEDLTESATDRQGTGERASVEPETPLGGDIAPDRIVSGRDAGLGGGLDQAEEAQLGITDEELEALRGEDGGD